MATATDRGRSTRKPPTSAPATARGAVAALRALAQKQVEAQPYGTLAAAFGAGWLLGGGLPPRVVVFVGGVGARLAAQELLRSLRSASATSNLRSA